MRRHQAIRLYPNGGSANSLPPIFEMGDSMYKMVSEYGNAIYFVETESEKEKMVRLGFHEEQEKMNNPRGVTPNGKKRKG